MNEMLAALAVPFPLDLIEFKPGATQAPKDGSALGKALGLAYVDPRHYYARLNDAAGTGWGDSYSMFPLADRLIIICSLTIDGVTRTGDGECVLTDPNCQTVASAQAFKRSCVKWGLGAGLYDAPQTWAEAKFGEARGNGKAPCYGFTDSGLAQLRRAFGGPAPVQPPPRSNGAKPAVKVTAETWAEPDSSGAELVIADYKVKIDGAVDLADLLGIGRQIEKASQAVKDGVRAHYKAAKEVLARMDPATIN